MILSPNQLLGVGLLLLSAAGSSLPDLGTKDFWKVWAHDFFKLITISRSQSK